MRALLFATALLFACGASDPESTEVHDHDHDHGDSGIIASDSGLSDQGSSIADVGADHDAGANEDVSSPVDVGAPVDLGVDVGVDLGVCSASGATCGGNGECCSGHCHSGSCH